MLFAVAATKPAVCNLNDGDSVTVFNAQQQISEIVSASAANLRDGVPPREADGF